jgi:hypothetical protein
VVLRSARTRSTSPEAHHSSKEREIHNIFHRIVFSLGMIDETAIGERYRALAGELDERRRRLWAAVAARATGMAENTIRRGLRELETGVRRPGAGARRPIRHCVRTWSGWWIPRAAATRSRPCGGRPRVCGACAMSCAPGAIGSRTRPWRGCCGGSATACRRPARYVRAPRPRCPVPTPQHHRHEGAGCWGAGNLGRHQEGGIPWRRLTLYVEAAATATACFPVANFARHGSREVDCTPRSEVLDEPSSATAS